MAKVKLVILLTTAEDSLWVVGGAETCDTTVFVTQLLEAAVFAEVSILATYLAVLVALRSWGQSRRVGAAYCFD